MALFFGDDGPPDVGEDVLGVATEDVGKEPPGLGQAALLQIRFAQQAVALHIVGIIAQHMLADGDGAIHLARLQRLFSPVVCLL